MEDDVEEPQLSEQPARLPAIQYYGLLLLIITAVGVFVSIVIGIVLGR